MPRKVFISFLGTNNYIRTHYSFPDNANQEEKLSKPVRFIQEALIDEYCRDWDTHDRIFIFYTEESYRKNWIDNGQISSDVLEDTFGLEQVLKKKDIWNIVEPVLIPEGFSENQMWDIFNILYQKLNQEDIIYFDITHAFRSIPIFAIVFFNYSKCLKNTSIASIYYGAFEKLGPAYKIKDMPIEERKAPIIDLSSIANLQSIINAASEYKQFGQISSIGNLLTPSKSKESKRQRRANEAISILQKELNNLDSYITVCDLENIKKGIFAKKILSMFDTVKGADNITKAEKILLEEVEQEIKKFKPEPSDENIESAINKAFRYRMIPQAYTLAQEYIISIAVEKLSKDIPDFCAEIHEDKDRRIFTSSLLAIRKDDIQNRTYKKPLSDHPKLTQNLLETWGTGAIIRTHYQQLTEFRNIVNHAKKRNQTEKDLIKEFANSYPAIIEALTGHRPTLNMPSC